MSSEADNSLGQDFERIAGALVHAVRRSVRESVDRRLCETRQPQSEQQTLSTSQDSQYQSFDLDTPQASQSTGANILATPGSNPASSTAYERAIMLQSTGRRDTRMNAAGSGTARRSFLPSAFKPAKRGRLKGSSSREQSSGPKPTLYQRDIMCLPCTSRRADGVIQIPRGTPRTQLAEVGLLGKVELTSLMTPEEVKSEICQVFMTPMALSKDDIANKKFFEFSYLQKTGVGSRSLCLPSVSQSFEWNGRQVASLAKSGGFIYILAARELPGCNLESSQLLKDVVLLSSEDDESQQSCTLITLSSDENYKDDDDDPCDIHDQSSSDSVRGLNNSLADGHSSLNTTANSLASTSTSSASREVLISSSEDESTEHLNNDVIAVSSDEMYTDYDDSGHIRNYNDTCDIQASAEASRTPLNNRTSQLASGSHNTTSSSEQTVRNAELQSTPHGSEFQPDVDRSQSHSSADNHDGEVDRLKLQEVFGDRLSTEQTASVYKISGEKFAASMECLLSGPTLESILIIMNRYHAEQPMIKVDINSIEAWEDAIALYKSSRLDLSKQIRVRINDQPAIDVGGVRAQLYSTVFDLFARNEKITLFDGNVRYLRPHCSAEARSSGLFKILGMMVGHSIMQDGIGFPYLSPVYYWHIAGREEKALESISTKDLNEDVRFLVTKLRDASTAADLDEIMLEEICCDAADIMSRCGVKTVLNLSTRFLIAQEIATYEGLYKTTHLLDQFSVGLKKAGLLEVIRAFPDMFLNLFVYKELTAADVLAAVCVSAEQNNDDHEVLLGYFNRFILECDETGLRSFMCHVTGAEFPHRKLIQLEFQEDAYGTISAHTCSNVISFPVGVFNSYDVFKESLEAVISGPPTFNTV